MYRPAEAVDWCQCCQQGVAFANLECASNLLGNYDSPQIVHSSDNAGCFHISFSFTDVGVRIPTGASALGMTAKYDTTAATETYVIASRKAAWQSVSLQ